MLKNQLHAMQRQFQPSGCSRAFRCTSPSVRLTRDLWNPFGLKDRGFFFLFAPASAAVFLWMAYSPLSYSGLFTGMLLVMFTFRFVTAAYWGLLALVGQEKLMSGA